VTFFFPVDQQEITCKAFYFLKSLPLLMLWLHHSLIHCGDAEVPPEGFGVGPQTLVHLLQDREYESLQKLGGVRPFFSSST
jgi:hypothetical protein